MGTGFAQPTRKMSRHKAPMISRCRKGFRDNLPECRGVGSPRRSETHPWAYSWLTMASRITGAINSMDWTRWPNCNNKLVSILHLGSYFSDMLFAVACNIGNDADRQGCCNIQYGMLLQEYCRQADQDRNNPNHRCLHRRM